MERIIVTPRLAAVQHHAHAHLSPPLLCRRFGLYRHIVLKMDHSRDPCPWVILNDFGGAFAMGVGAHAHIEFGHQLIIVRLSVVQYGTV